MKMKYISIQSGNSQYTYVLQTHSTTQATISTNRTERPSGTAT